MGKDKQFSLYIISTVVGERVCYVGATSRDISIRWREHCHQTACAALHAAICSLGRDAFTITQVASARGVESVKMVEAALIKQYNTLAPNGYNKTTGGNGGFEMSADTRARMSRSKKGKAPLAALAAMKQIQIKRAAMKQIDIKRAASRPRTCGFSDEHRQRLSDALKGKPRGDRLSPEGRARMVAVSTGRLHSAETLAKLRGRIVSPETRAKLSSSHTAERREQQSMRMVNYHASLTSEGRSQNAKRARASQLSKGVSG